MQKGLALIAIRRFAVSWPFGFPCPNECALWGVSLTLFVAVCELREHDVITDGARFIGVTRLGNVEALHVHPNVRAKGLLECPNVLGHSMADLRLPLLLATPRWKAT